jgi:hypothetical protein
LEGGENVRGNAVGQLENDATRFADGYARARGHRFLMGRILD